MRSSKLFPILTLAILLALAFTLARVVTVDASQDQGAAATSTIARPLELSEAAFTPKADNAGAEADDAIQRLIEATNGTASVSRHRATGVASFVRLQEGTLPLSADKRASAEARAAAFFEAYGAAFGITDASRELELVETKVDEMGMTHLTYHQRYRGLPVWAATLKVHFYASGDLAAVNGVVVPNIAVAAVPTLNESVAASIARTDVAENTQVEDGVAPDLSATALNVAASTLLVYHDGLAQGIKGTSHLAYEVEVTYGTLVREFVFVDAHSGAVLNRLSGIHQDLNRVLYEMVYDPSAIVWSEGDPFPGTLNEDQQNIVKFSGDSYWLFFNAFARDSYDNNGATMESVNNDPTIACPNANWNGVTTNYCDGTTADDVVAHEWGHAYTEYTSDLIYQWQPGALNESYSDVWGEVADIFNGEGTDTPGGVRTVGVCSTYTSPQVNVRVNAPPDIAGDYAAQSAAFGPPLDTTGVTGDVVLANDGTGTTTDACEPLVNGGEISGNIALVDRGSCTFTTKVLNAQNAGAVGVIVANNVVGPPVPMGGSDPTITIPSVMVALATGNLMKDRLPTPGVNATMSVDPVPTEDSYRWLVGEDATAFGEAIRDMWDPTCKADAGKVSDDEYHCATSDNGGVHSNSGVPNHAFALLVDGGTYNGQTINAIGWVKASHIWWRTQEMYLTQSSDFVDFADGLEASCSDLMGIDLEGISVEPVPAGPSGEIIDATDCAAVSAAIAATELRLDPSTQCQFEPILEPNPPALCAGTGNAPVSQYFTDFTTLADWTLTNEGVYAGWPGYDWMIEIDLPGGRTGEAAYGIDPDVGNCDLGGGDVSGVMHMDSMAITIPMTATDSGFIAFDHYVATEANWDGGNLKISINGGPWEVISDTAFIYNPFNDFLNPASQGNTNPLAGEPAYTGTDGGEVGGSWGQTQIDLSAMGVQPGDSVMLRYDMGIDGCTGIDGWYIDWVDVYTCSGAPTAVTLGELESRPSPVNLPLAVVTFVGLIGLAMAWRHKREA